MPLDSTRANAKTESINGAFAEIGHSGTTVMPRRPSNKDNLEPIAWEVFMSKHLKRLADAREKKAVVAAVKAGVMFDHTRQPLAEGTNALVYAGDIIEISCSVTTPGTKLDTVSLFNELETKHGVKVGVIAKLTEKFTSYNACPHKFVATIITSRQ